MPPKKKPKRPWQETAKEAQEYRDASLARVSGLSSIDKPVHLNESILKNFVNIPREILPSLDVQITETLPENLIQALASGELSATDVTAAFLRRAVLAQKFVHIPLLARLLFGSY